LRGRSIIVVTRAPTAILEGEVPVRLASAGASLRVVPILSGAELEIASSIVANTADVLPRALRLLEYCVCTRTTHLSPAGLHWERVVELGRGGVVIVTRTPAAILERVVLVPHAGVRARCRVVAVCPGSVTEVAMVTIRIAILKASDDCYPRRWRVG
jgi:hypothetical protein